MPFDRLPSQSNYSFNYNIAGMRKGIHKSFLLHWLNITLELFMEFIDCTTIITCWRLYFIAKFIDFKNQFFQLISQPSVLYLLNEKLLDIANFINGILIKYIIIDKKVSGLIEPTRKLGYVKIYAWFVSINCTRS